ncbi:CDP-diacylglycerol-glycerol-3-phosphate 3-phosphatidyltransferase [Spiroplasma helicoides]|uniref:CDP-diacylglycerol--glycerol-3-phosphate 3-phosphatidyltransferase n=1 Tax=Spiroplasma helicoides TaxID=216938 RepID=A0A1B3SLF3_9MOLU|nr:CDP-diacylglycerol--glycerol-3-phosphate 3-phosphatidyltransferase [Spiroplasma helicoides]AOG60753.1 CDP-diacylglycerol-glycerol-3-phosphate 3-phosphatidyltransferase [Spiroplasma helicoides]
MNLANKITMIRIVLVPIIVVLMLLCNFDNTAPNTFGVLNNLVIDTKIYKLPIVYLVAGILFIISSFTDMLDGYVARKYKMVTTFGKFFDSIADKLLTNSILIVFAVVGAIPVWMCVILIGRDFMIDVVRQILASSKVVMAANQLGRYRATAEMAGLSILFFVGYRFFGGESFGTQQYDEFGWVNQIVMIPMYLTTILSIAAAINYIYLNRKVLFSTTLQSSNSSEKRSENEKIVKKEQKTNDKGNEVDV